MYVYVCVKKMKKRRERRGERKREDADVNEYKQLFHELF